MAAFGGTAPYVGTALINADRIQFFGYYVSVLAVISLLVYLGLRETKGQPLPE